MSYAAIAEALIWKEPKAIIQAIKDFIDTKKKVPKLSQRRKAWEGWTAAILRGDDQALISKIMDCDLEQLGRYLKSMYQTRKATKIIYPEMVPFLEEQLKLLKAYIKQKTKV